MALAFDLRDSHARFGHLTSCFTCERKRKTIASFASKLLKTQSFETPLFEQLLANEICSLKEPNVFPAVAHLVKEKKAAAKEIAAMAPFMGQQCSKDESPVLQNFPEVSKFNLEMPSCIPMVMAYPAGMLPRYCSTPMCLAWQRHWPGCGPLRPWRSTMPNATLEAPLA